MKAPFALCLNHTDDKVGDLITKAFDVSTGFQFLVCYYWDDKSIADALVKGWEMCFRSSRRIQDLKARSTKLKKQAKPYVNIKPHKAYLKRVSLKAKIPRKRLLKDKQKVQQRVFPEDQLNHWTLRYAQDEGRTREIVVKTKEIEENVLTKAVSREKEKGVELKDVDETNRPKPTSTRSLLTLKPLPKIDPKDKGKKRLKRRDEYESELLARIEADRLLAEKLQRTEESNFTIEERAKFLRDTIAMKKIPFAQQRSEAIRELTSTKNQELIPSKDDMIKEESKEEVQERKQRRRIMIKMSFGVHSKIGRLKEVSFEKGSTDADAEIELELKKTKYYAIRVD
ncbi:hypothetical protein Tco_0086825 [Tanacetum coccineum]